MATSRARGSETAPTTDEDGLSVLFGQEIRRRRQALGFSQEDLADRAHLDRTTIGRVERGEFRATLEVAKAMAYACNLSLWQVLKEVEQNVTGTS